MELRWKQPSEPRVQNHKDMKTATVLPLTRLHGDNKSEKKHLSSVNLRIIQVSASRLRSDWLVLRHQHLFSLSLSDAVVTDQDWDSSLWPCPHFNTYFSKQIFSHFFIQIINPVQQNISVRIRRLKHQQVVMKSNSIHSTCFFYCINISYYFIY